MALATKRREDEAIILESDNGPIEIVIRAIRGNSVHLDISAPPSVKIILPVRPKRPDYTPARKMGR
jgi:sRNA-binding carbon storage regulator CsrA